MLSFVSSVPFPSPLTTSYLCPARDTVDVCPENLFPDPALLSGFLAV